MKRLCQIAAIFTPLLVLPSALAFEVAPKEIAARTELYQVQTLTLSDQQFLKGDIGGKPVTISGQLRIAQGSGRLPVVVLQHGSSGYAANIDVWSRELNELGISTFALDGFTGRGLTEVNTNQALLGRLNLILDIYRALDVLASHPRVDPGRIALMGFSRGGQATIYASLKRFHQLWNKSGRRICRLYTVLPGLHDDIHIRNRSCRSADPHLWRYARRLQPDLRVQSIRRTIARRGPGRRIDRVPERVTRV